MLDKTLTFIELDEDTIFTPSTFKNTSDFIILQGISNSLALKNIQIKFTQVKVINAKNKPFQAEILKGKCFFVIFLKLNKLHASLPKPE